MMVKKILALLIAGTMAAGMFIGCGSSSASSTSSKNTTSTASSTTVESSTNTQSGTNTESSTNTASSSEESSATMEIVDMDGNTVTVPTPENLKGFIITDPKGAIEAAALLGVLDKVMSSPGVDDSALLAKANPEVVDLPIYADFSTVNAEEILQAGADFVIVGGPTHSTKEQLESLGITVVVDGVTVDDSDSVFESNNAEIRLIAELTGTEDRADEYFEWADEIYDLVEERVADIPEEDKVRFLSLRSSMTNIYNNNGIYSYVTIMAGGYNVAGDLSAEQGGGFFLDVDAEVIVEANPEMIFVTMGATSSSYEEWAADERYANLDAILTGDVYQIPTGIGLWNQSIETPLCVLWMAKLMYPDLFEDIDPKEVANDFYLKFFDYTPTEEDWANIAWNFDGGKNNGLSD